MMEFFQKKGVDMELAELLIALLEGVKEISESIIRTEGGKAGTYNAFGEEQARMDLQAEHILEDVLRGCPFVKAFSSEELDQLQEMHSGGRFSVFYDPLDGSSLLDVNFAVGTIVGIFEGGEVLERTCREQVAAFYSMYGPATTVMLALGGSVMELKLQKGVWTVTQESVHISSGKKYFAPGNLRACKERQDYFDLVNWYIQEQYTLRYSGGMVPDVNHILKKGGGLFMYPGTPSKPEGKLRLLYECGPMAMILEAAGGAASDGERAILDLPIESLVQTTPILIGDRGEVERAEKALGPEL